MVVVTRTSLLTVAGMDEAFWTAGEMPPKASKMQYDGVAMRYANSSRECACPWA